MFSSLHRLSYYQRIVDIVPESFSALVPAKPTTIYKFGGEAASGKSILMTKIGQGVEIGTGKKTIMMWLKHLPPFFFKMK